MTHDPHSFSDRELDTLLAGASRPPIPLGARERLLAKLAQQGGEDQQAPFNSAASTHTRSRLTWLAGLPLAASLALGIYLGAAGAGASILPTSAYELLAGVNIDDSGTGIEEAEGLSEDSLT